MNYQPTGRDFVVENRDNYTFFVKAKNGAGSSAASDSAVVQYPTGSRNVPWAGANVRIGANASGSLTVKWELPMSLSRSWGFEGSRGATGWSTNATNAFAVMAHPDNSTQIGGEQCFCSSIGILFTATCFFKNSLAEIK